MDPYSKLLLCTALGLHCAKLTRLTHLPSFRQVVHMCYEGYRKMKIALQVAKTCFYCCCDWFSVPCILFAKIKDMNLEDLGSQFISNFHQSQNQIQPLYISVKVSIIVAKSVFDSGNLFFEAEFS